jgi:hypothetical protein
MVGQAIATKLVALGHDTKLGSRAADNDNALAWVAAAGQLASEGSFADAAAFGEVLFNCTSGAGALAALEGQRALPEVRVVRSLNTMNCEVMVDPGLVPGDHARSANRSA